MKIGGFQKTSLLDYPKKICAIVWTVGCNFNCPFCYNVDLVKGKDGTFPEEDILTYLEKRKNMLEGLVITGGEPLMQKDITIFCEKIKKLGYEIKIDTNGTFPEIIQELINKKLVDYIAMDVKAPKDKYDELSGKKVDIEKIQKSIDIIQKSKIVYEFKTTFVPGLLKKEDIFEIGKWLKGSKKYFLQQFKSEMSLLSDDLTNTPPYSKQDFFETIKKVKPFFEYCDVRGV
jgi:pyruvate formate lyase activating enzyme